MSVFTKLLWGGIGAYLINDIPDINQIKHFTQTRTNFEKFISPNFDHEDPQLLSIATYLGQMYMTTNNQKGTLVIGTVLPNLILTFYNEKEYPLSIPILLLSSFNFWKGDFIPMLIGLFKVFLFDNRQDVFVFDLLLQKRDVWKYNFDIMFELNLLIATIISITYSTKKLFSGFGMLGNILDFVLFILIWRIYNSYNLISNAAPFFRYL